MALETTCGSIVAILDHYEIHSINKNMLTSVYLEVNMFLSALICILLSNKLSLLYFAITFGQPKSSKTH